MIASPALLQGVKRTQWRIDELGPPEQIEGGILVVREIESHQN